MSADHAGSHGPDAGHGGHGADDHHDGGHHGSMRSYLRGFALSVVLTAIPFWLVMTGAIENPRTAALVIMAFAAVQIVVHMIYFLHMSASAEEGWTLLSTGFTIVVVVITLAGSLWIMFHLDRNMMPGHQMDLPFEQP